jgi:phosphatidylinositol 4-kinase
LAHLDLCIKHQDKLCKANNWQRAQPTIDVVLLLSEIRIGTGKSDNWSTQTGNIPAVLAAAAASSGANLKVSESFNLEVISSGKCNQAAATVKCNHAGEIAGMRRLYNSIGGFQSSTTPTTGFGLGAGLQRIISGAFPQQPQAEDDSFNGMLLNKFVRLLQQFVNIAEKGGEVVRSEFRETCSQATVLLLSNLVSTFLPPF